MAPDLTLASQTSWGSYKYRPLHLTGPFMRGADCFALQSALGVTADGIFGPQTEAAVRSYQTGAFPDPRDHDAIAGVKTQRQLALDLILEETSRLRVPEPLMRGQVEHESGFQLGNHTPPYPDGSRDEGVCQRNTNYIRPIGAFNVQQSIAALVTRLAQKHADYVTFGKVTDSRRLWLLAAGSWNAPAWTDTLAHGGTLPAGQSALIEGYMRAVSTYF